MPAGSAHAQANGGSIQGQITNGSQGANPESSAGLTVTLYSADMQAQQTYSETTVSDVSGRFAFSNLAVVSSTRYIAAATYQGIEYTSDITGFDGLAATLSLPLAIYETTTDPTAIHVDVTHFIIDVQTGQLAVNEVLQVHNRSDRSYVGAGAGSPRTTLTLPLLPNAGQVQFVQPQNADSTTLRGTDVLSYTLPFQPGEDQIVFQYTVPITPPTYSFNLRLPFDTDEFRLLVSDVGETITSTQLSAPAQFAAPGGLNYLQSTASKLTSGTRVQAAFENLPASVAPPAAGDTSAAPTTAPADTNSALIGFGALAAAAVAAAVFLAYPIVRKRTAAGAPASDRRTELLRAIADLDDDFEAGKVSETTYREERARLKSKAMELGDRR